MLCGLWVLLFVRLLLPTDFAHSFSGRALVQRFMDRVLMAPEPVPVDQAIHPALKIVDKKPILRSRTQQSLFTVSNVLVLGWLAGFLTLVLIYLRQLTRYYRLVHKARPCTDAHLNLHLVQWRQEFNVRRRVRIVTGSTGSPPFTVGLFRPVIYISESLCRDTGAIESIIAHEMVHIKHLDDVWIKLQNLIQFVYFFNPAVWLAGFHLTQMREQLCDAMVLSRGRISNQTYGNGLLNSIQFNVSRPDYLLTLAAFGSKRERLYDRILNIKRPAVFKKWQFILSTLVLIGLGWVILPMAKSPVVQGEPVELINPLKHGHIGLEYGIDWDTGLQANYLHKGIDIKLPGRASNIWAAADGNVVSTGKDEIFGGFREVTIDHANGWRTRYLHLDQVYVKPGQSIKKAQQIGHVPYALHFEVYKDGVLQDPEDYLTLEKKLIRQVVKPDQE